MLLTFSAHWKLTVGCGFRTGWGIVGPGDPANAARVCSAPHRYGRRAFFLAAFRCDLSQFAVELTGIR